MGCALWPSCFVTCLLRCPLDAAGAWEGWGCVGHRVHRDFVEMEEGVFSMACWGCILLCGTIWKILVLPAESCGIWLLGDVGSKKDFPWSFCESDWDCHAKGSTALSKSRERREVWWCRSFKGLSAVDICPDEMFKICLPWEMWVARSVSYCGSGVWHLIWIAAKGKGLWVSNFD